MITIDIAKKQTFDSSDNTLAFLLPQKFDLNDEIIQLGKEKKIDLKECLKTYNFKGSANSEVMIINESTKMLFVGLGNLTESNPKEKMESVRNGLGNLIQACQKYSIDTVSLMVGEGEPFEKNNDDFLQDLVTTALLANYKFDELKNKNSKKDAHNLTLKMYVDCDTKRDANEIALEGKIIAESMNISRRMMDLPANIATPGFIAEEASQMAEKFGLEYTVFNQKQIEEMGMGGILAVCSGSRHEPKLVEIKYNSSNPNAKTLAIVGKGVTFDTGGVSLKPANYMSGMKYDMSGAAAAIGIIRAISQINPDVNVVAMAPLVENMPDGGSYRQDDIVTHYNGVTSEIINTDAEGRLILADALAYVEKVHNPETIIDIATLTGACMVALGTFYSGLMSTDQTLADTLKKIGDQCGDPVWQLPCTKEYDAAIESDVADILNCGKPSFYAGAITAGRFLKKFVKTNKWAHLDIAGTESKLPVRSYLGKGATGASMRLLIEFIKQYR